MKAIRVHQFGGPEVLKYEMDARIPEIGSEDVLVEVKSVGVNPVETYIRSGQYARTPDLPYTPGNDCSGIVKEVGASVNNIAIGQRVFTSKTNSGSYAQFTSAPAKYVHLLTDELSFQQGAALSSSYLTAYRALVTKGNIHKGELVLIHGASGGVGVAAVQMARAYGAVVIGTAGTDKGFELVQKAGAHHTVNHRSPNYIDTIKKIAESNGGIDVIFENNAHLNLEKDLSMMSSQGRVLVVGNRGTIEINPRQIMSTEASVIGVMLFKTTEKERDEYHSAIYAGIKNKWLVPIIGKEFSLQNASDAHQDIIHGKGALGKMVLNVE